MFVVAPIHRVQKGLDIIASGNLDYHIDASSNDELGKLARAFNNMAGQIKEIHGTLEQKINAQTENLNEKIILLQETERALINVMDDLEKEKASIARDRAEYKALIESIGDGVIALDDKGYITYINQNAANMLGWEREHIAHAHYTDVWTVQNESGKILSQEERPMFQALVSGKKTTTSLTPTYYYTRKNGTRFPVAISITPIIIDSVNKGVIDIFKDITHLKEIDKAKGEFVSLASHQLRTPTATINWYTELLLNGSAGAVTRKQKDFLEEIYTAAKRMVQLIDALLNVSRLELGTLPIKKIPTDIALLIDDIIHELSQDIKRKKISIKKDYQDRLLPLFTDPDLIRIIFENLISNAVDYNHENGSLILSIKKENSHLLISIADTGYGIPKHQQSQIFQKMFRADNIRIIDPNGNGLGLYMTKSILEKLGGAIWFKSEEDKGTTFFFTLPL
jgi:PAS domain S-box-containing protein